MASRLLWQPSKQRVESSNMFRFMQKINRKYQYRFQNYAELYQWSIECPNEFWAEVFDQTKIIASTKYERVVDDVHRMPGAKWFHGARLNFAENLLRCRTERLAIVAADESGTRVRMTYGELYDQVARLSHSLRQMGVAAGDRVSAFIPNIPEAVVAMLAATSLGAIYSSCSPDFGVKGVLDRFSQIQPKVLFTADGYRFKGKVFDSLATLSKIVSQLPSVEKVIVVGYMDKHPDIHRLPKSVHYHDFLSSPADGTIEFEQLPFDHPLYIMYSSGTTGLPKCMVQSIGGVLLNHLKEHALHTDIRPEDNLFYFTTCGWMMWNWLVSALASEATIVLFDGNPFYPDPLRLWRMAEQESITVFGTSAGYITALMNSVESVDKAVDLGSVKTLLSTGAPLSTEGFEFVYRQIKEDIQLSSISGGTDLNGCFALGNPLTPVYAGEIQALGLGMKVRAFDETGRAVVGKPGELVCTQAFPSMPIYFWDDENGQKYHAAYFNDFPNVWRHGDFIEINHRGGVIIHGRSDATLNPKGVRIGTAEIYRIVEQIEEVEDSIVVGPIIDGEVRVLLFVKLIEGKKLGKKLREKIQNEIRQQASVRHMPDKIFRVSDIPYTLNMKKVELSVRNILEGKAVQNRDALMNPASLNQFRKYMGTISE